MKKTELRKLGIAALHDLAKQPQAKAEKEQLIYQRLFESKAWQAAKSIGVTLSMVHELNTQPIIDRAFSENKVVAVPKTYPDRRMQFIQIREDSLFTTSTFGVKEPKNEDAYQHALDLLLVPGVVFHSEGYRVGFGGGYYDRYLATFKGQTASVLFEEQLRSDWQPEAFDLPVTILITDKTQMEVQK